jgi:hypothetical protein
MGGTWTGEKCKMGNFCRNRSEDLSIDGRIICNWTS